MKLNSIQLPTVAHLLNALRSTLLAPLYISDYGRLTSMRNSDPELTVLVFEDGGELSYAEAQDKGLTLDTYSRPEIVRLVMIEDDVKQHIVTTYPVLKPSEANASLFKYLECEGLHDERFVVYITHKDGHSEILDPDNFDCLDYKHDTGEWDYIHELDAVYVCDDVLSEMQAVAEERRAETKAVSHKMLEIPYRYRVGDVLETNRGQVVIADILESYDVVDGERVTRRGSKLVVFHNSNYGELSLANALCYLHSLNK